MFFLFLFFCFLGGAHVFFLLFSFFEMVSSIFNNNVNISRQYLQWQGSRYYPHHLPSRWSSNCSLPPSLLGHPSPIVPTLSQPSPSSSSLLSSLSVIIVVLLRPHHPHQPPSPPLRSTSTMEARAWAMWA